MRPRRDPPRSTAIVWFDLIARLSGLVAAVRLVRKERAISWNMESTKGATLRVLRCRSRTDDDLFCLFYNDELVQLILIVFNNIIIGRLATKGSLCRRVLMALSAAHETLNWRTLRRPRGLSFRFESSQLATDEDCYIDR